MAATEKKSQKDGSMDPEGIFSSTITTLGRALDLRSKKHRLIVSNIANMETPGYKPFDLRLDQALGRDKTGKIGLAATHPGHLQVSPAPGIDPIIRRAPEPGSEKGDGNAVDIDREMSALAENSLLYSVLTRTISRKFNGLKTAISGGSQR